MYELFQEAIRPVNLPYTVLFGLTALYWILYLVGVFGSDLLDFDFDGEVDGGGNGHGGEGGSFLGGIFHFVYASEVPVTVIASTLSIAMWCISILTNYYTNNTNVLFAALLFLPILIGGILVTRIALMPFVPLLKKAFDESSDVIHVIGQLCVVTSMTVTEKHGQAEVPIKGAPLLLNVKCRDGLSLAKGEEAVIVAKDSDETYIIAPFEGDTNKEVGSEV